MSHNNSQDSTGSSGSYGPPSSGSNGGGPYPPNGHRGPYPDGGPRTTGLKAGPGGRNFPFLAHSGHPAHPTPPPYTQPPPPTPANLEVTALRVDGEDLTALNHGDLCRRLISVKGDLKKLAVENGNIVSELNKKIQEHQTEIRSLKEMNHRLTEDNQELRDLCCFLDDDRQKGRKLAREWQRFGRYTASVMRQEVSNYQTKLRDLDGKQQAMVKDNIELKELCLYLDEERGNVTACSECGGPVLPPVLPTDQPPLHPRDEGDGSSSSTNPDDSEISTSNLADELNAVRAREELYNKQAAAFNKSGLNDDVLLYIRSLERKLGLSPDPVEEVQGDSWGTRPQAVSNAFKVLSIQEGILERSSLEPEAEPDHLGDGERALVREMCNVVWKKLEET